MRRTQDRPETGQPADQQRRVTVQEAATLLGLSEDAVRSRLKRGTLRKEKGPDGTVFVVLVGGKTGDRSAANGDRPTTDKPTGPTDLALMQAHLDSLSEQLVYLREQLDHEREANRENRRIIAGLVQRVPQLEAPRNGHETAAAEPDREDTPPGAQEAAERRSWLYRFFVGP